MQRIMDMISHALYGQHNVQPNNRDPREDDGTHGSAYHGTHGSPTSTTTTAEQEQESGATSQPPTVSILDNDADSDFYDVEDVEENDEHLYNIPAHAETPMQRKIGHFLRLLFVAFGVAFNLFLITFITHPRESFPSASIIIGHMVFANVVGGAILVLLWLDHS
ncbi:unnamed protein product [Cuscuta europaea]|nr:unnamed protein product [Cuscuta europaea]